MPFDFPDSPTTGQVYSSNGVAWQYDGEKWKGGAPARQSDEQWIAIPAGATTYDIPVPAWAQSAQFIGNFFLSNGGSVPIIVVSTDGSTFFTAATAYYIGGTVINTGSSGVAQQPTQDYPGIIAGVTGDNSANAIPIESTLEFNVVRPNTTASFVGKLYAKAYDSAATMNYRSAFWTTVVKNATVGSALALKALRVTIYGSGTFAAGTWLKVKWLGDVNALPQSGAITAPPSDGNEYTMVNGVWRLKAQTLVLDNLSTIDVDVPAAAKALRIDGMLYYAASSASNSVVFRVSMDGTTFLSGASEYFYGGMAHYTGSSGFMNLAPANVAYGPLTFASDNITQPQRFKGLLPMRRGVNTQLMAGTVNVGWYHSPTANGYTDFQFGAGWQAVGLGNQVAKMRFYNFNTGFTFAPVSSIYCEWVY